MDPAYDALFRSAYPQAVRVARRIVGETPVAEDLASEALTRAFVHWRRLQREPWAEPWVLRVTANLAIDHVRRRRPLAAPPVTGTAADDLVVLRAALVAALSKLPRRQRDVVVLRYLTDLSEADTAAVLGVSAGTVKTHLHRGLTALRGVIGPGPEEETRATAP